MSTTTHTSATEVATALTARLATILTAGGSATNMGARVRRGKLAVDNTDVPCISVIEGADQVQPNPSKKSTTAHIEQNYAIVGYVACDAENPNDAAHAAIRDIKRSIFGDRDATWGGTVRGVAYKGRNIGPRADGVAIVQVIVEIAIEYAEDMAA